MRNLVSQSKILFDVFDTKLIRIERIVQAIIIETEMSKLIQFQILGTHD